MSRLRVKHRGGADRPILHAAQRQRNQRDDDQGVEDDGRENRALRRREMHDVERLQFGIADHEHRRNDREVLGDVVGD